MKVLIKKTVILLCLILTFGTLNGAYANQLNYENLDGYGVGTVDLQNMAYLNSSGFVSVAYSGSGTASVMGKFDFVAKHAIRWDLAVPNGSGGLCAPSSGQSTLTGSDQGRYDNHSTLIMNFTGTFCEVGHTVVGTETTAHMPTIPFAFTGTYFITGGTGRFSGPVSGSGEMTGSTDSAGKLIVIVDGKIAH